MSNYIPRWTPEMLEEYRRNLASKQGRRAAPTPEAAPNPARTPAHAPATPPRPMTPYSPSESEAVPLRAAGGKMTQTEARYNRDVLFGKGVSRP